MSQLIKGLPGDGGQIRFWLDAWCDTDPLAVSFPTLFKLEKHKNCLIRDRLQLLSSGDITINWDWSQAPYEHGDLERLTVCSQIIEKVVFRGGMDTWRWLGSPDGNYSTKSFRLMWPSRSEFSKNVAPCPSFRRMSFSDLSRSSSMRINEDIAQTFGPELIDFKLSELRAITQNFSTNFLLGEGGFGKVHKGYLDESMRPGLKSQPIAVKLLDIEGLQGISVCLPWGIRIKIAIGAAKGLAFLHGAESPVIYRDFKTSNILLDSEFNAKLSDFGLATMGPEGSNTHVTTRVMGTYGYAAPEYVNTVRTVIDPRLGGQYSVRGAKEVALLALYCVSLNPKDRPKMPAIIETLESLKNYRDMAITCGQWPPASHKTQRNEVYTPKELKEINGGRIYWKQTHVKTVIKTKG
ncbi:hypothetical protein E3N88_17255 [Mikania micrantha]|uniref:Protein kinase domain-containing protein n=1 Tax=Mikania micrantha TaxID=192012 RepID=A0A5N6NSR4_9ASTR|nr:hypothetical protein E3N88_17255 [Mikania micrantha]